MIRNFLPSRINRNLFGDRERYGQRADPLDPDWQLWQKVFVDAYNLTQKANRAGNFINQSGYEVLRRYNFARKSVAEIGPGGGHHFAFISGKMAEYFPVDSNKQFLTQIVPLANTISENVKPVLVEPQTAKILLPDNSVDFVLSFYSLEHLYPLGPWIDEIFRILKPGGQLVGAIPTEGGVLWGLGRYFTSRRILKKKFNLDIYKIVCWEHPNFCDSIMAKLNSSGQLTVHNWPMRFAPADLNLLQIFMVKKSSP